MTPALDSVSPGGTLPELVTKLQEYGVSKDRTGAMIGPKSLSAK